MYITPQGNRNCPSVQTMVMKRNNGITETVVEFKKMMIRITNIILKILLLLQGHQKTDILDRVILPVLC